MLQLNPLDSARHGLASLEMPGFTLEVFQHAPSFDRCCLPKILFHLQLCLSYLKLACAGTSVAEWCRSASQNLVLSSKLYKCSIVATKKKSEEQTNIYISRVCTVCLRHMEILTFA
jgi:hypothetical protein